MIRSRMERESFSRFFVTLIFYIGLVSDLKLDHANGD